LCARQFGDNKHTGEVNGGAKSASTGKRKYGNGKYEIITRFLRMENASTANISMNLQGWKM